MGRRLRAAFWLLAVLIVIEKPQKSVARGTYLSYGAADKEFRHSNRRRSRHIATCEVPNARIMGYS
uniref:HDC17121 n=1 Tax=Drosophila melanogaster TaxID=7227 RepID=Q6IIT6_DROME|nr:TPA_inf: HDC17121 [Drosophila melanogaster]